MALTYKMSFVEDRIGAKINLKDNYYDAQAIESYEEKGKRLLKFVKKDDEEEDVIVLDNRSRLSK